MRWSRLDWGKLPIFFWWFPWFIYRAEQLDKDSLTMGSNNENDQYDSADWRVCIFEDKFFYLLSCQPNLWESLVHLEMIPHFSFEVIYLISEKALTFHTEFSYIILFSSPTSNLIAWWGIVFIPVVNISSNLPMHLMP